MKKLLFISALTMAMLAANTGGASAQSNTVYAVWSNGIKAGLTVPTLTTTRSQPYPTTDAERLTPSGTMTLTINEATTDVVVDSVQNNAVISFTSNLPTTACCTLNVMAGGASDTSRSLFLKVGSTPFDTLTVTNHKPGAHQSYWWDGSIFQANKK